MVTGGGTPGGCGSVCPGVRVPDSTTSGSAGVAEQPLRIANPVIEQAKSIVMAQLRCTSEEAFDLLRRASQRANIKVSMLAAQLIEQAPGWR